MKLVTKLQRRRVREQTGLCVAEGEDLVEAGIETGCDIHTILVDESYSPRISFPSDKTVHVTEQLMSKVSELAHPPRTIGIFHQPVVLPKELANVSIVLDAVSDPGNVGTIIRTAAALGAKEVILLKGCSDPWSGKAMRASMGSCFRINIKHISNYEELFTSFSNVIVLDGKGSVELKEVEFCHNTAIVVGNERNGVTQALFDKANQVVFISQDSKVESLNVSVAASLALYEWSRKK